MVLFSRLKMGNIKFKPITFFTGKELEDEWLKEKQKKFLPEEAQKELEFLKDYEKICQKHNVNFGMCFFQVEKMDFGYFIGIEFLKDENKVVFNYEFEHWVGANNLTIFIQNADLKFFSSLDKAKYKEIEQRLCFIRKSRKELQYVYYNAKNDKYMFADKDEYDEYEWKDSYINVEEE